jgi:hypothetical protein
MVDSVAAGACTGAETEGFETAGGADDTVFDDGTTAGTLFDVATAAAAAMTGTPTAPFVCTTAVSPTPGMVRVILCWFLSVFEGGTELTR